MYTETDCTITHEGRAFESGGAVVTPDRAVAYVKAANERPGCAVEITDWHGRMLGHGVITAVWRTPRSYVSSHMLQIRAVIDGVAYTGRSCGNGMVWSGRRAAR